MPDTPAPAAAPGIDTNAIVQQLLQQAQLPRADTTPVNRSFTSLLGEALGGGDMVNMSPAQREAAGTRALLAFGAGMSAAGGYHNVRTTLGEAMAQGTQAALGSEGTSQQAAYTALSAQQKLALEQQQMRIAALKEALPLLQMSKVQGLPSSLVAGGTPPAPSPNAPGALAAKPPPAAAPSGGPPAAPDGGGAGGPPALPTPPIPPPTPPPALSPLALQELTKQQAAQTGQTIPVPGTGLSATPAGNLKSSGEVQIAGPPGVVPMGPPAPQAPSQADQPPAPPAAVSPPAPAVTPNVIPATFEEYYAQHPTKLPPELQALTTGALTDEQRKNIAIINQAYTNQRGAAISSADVAKAESDLMTSLTKQNEQLTQTQKDARDTVAKFFQDDYNNKFNSWSKAHEIDLAHAGKIGEMQQQADITQGNEAVKNAADNAAEARKVIAVLQQIDLNNLPKGAVAAFLDSHPEAAGWLRIGGLLDPKEAGGAQLLNAARSYLSLILKPVGTGALRNQEMANLMSFTPSMLQDPDTQREMLGRLMAINRRAIDEYDFVSGYMGRTDPKTGQPIYNIRGLGAAMDAAPTYDANGNKTGGGLGSILAEPPPADAPRDQHLAYRNYVQRNIQPGMPYVTYQRDPATNQLQRKTVIRGYNDGG